MSRRVISSDQTHQNVAPIAPPGRPRKWRCRDCGVEATSRELFQTACETAAGEVPETP